MAFSTESGLDPELIGYADRLVAEPGETIRFMVSTDLPMYQASLVRVIHGDENPVGPGFKCEHVGDPPSPHSGRIQRGVSGSYVKVQPSPVFACLSFTLQAWIFPTAPLAGSLQGVLSNWTNESGGYRLMIEPEGDLSLSIGHASGTPARVRTGVKLEERYWYFVAGTYDAVSGQALVRQVPLSPWLRAADSVAAVELAEIRSVAAEAPFLIGAASLERSSKGACQRPFGAYDGKIDCPRLFRRQLNGSELDRLQRGELPDSVGGDALIAAWDFGMYADSTKAWDVGPFHLHGEMVNMPTRGVTSHGWTGWHFDHTQAQDEYGAIHFHSDDVEDAGWEVDFAVRIPQTARSGVYAAQLEGEGISDYVPFFVRPQRGKASADALVLMPTMTYLAYANERIEDWSGAVDKSVRDPRDEYLAQHPELGNSTYDVHSDGSGVCFSSFLRPIVNLRPNYRWWISGGPERLPADLYLIDWLEHEGFAYDLATDHDLHREGVELLSRYRVVLAPTHPEYWTTPMMKALEEYLTQGGRLMYLGGNGFYCVVGVHPERQHVIEVRRANGSRTWACDPGEEHLSTTGERGGIWRSRGRSPNGLVGNGFGAMAMDFSASTASPYRRLPGSFDPRTAFIFEGVGEDEIIGNFGLLNDGAAGYEIDRFDHRLGTPPHALLLATSFGEHTSGYLMVVEDLLMTKPNLDGPSNPNVRADMVYMEGPTGGAVFSVGSINWCGSLSWNAYSNNVARITRNVLRGFLSEDVPARDGGTLR